MPRVLVVNNYPNRDRVERLERCVRENGASVTPIEWDEVSARRFDSFDGVILSGSPAMITEGATKSRFQGEADAILDSEVPILGVCFGHQLMAHAFGGEVLLDRRHVFKMARTVVLSQDSLFKRLPKSIMLLESRYEVVKSLPKGFNLLAKSEASEIATTRHRTRPLYGVQFHPERYTVENPEGKRVVGNFVSLLE
jgi:GMP synthase (glutamine-hydrolysing)